MGGEGGDVSVRDVTCRCNMFEVYKILVLRLHFNIYSIIY